MEGGAINPALAWQWDEKLGGEMGGTGPLAHHTQSGKEPHDMPANQPTQNMD